MKIITVASEITWHSGHIEFRPKTTVEYPTGNYTQTGPLQRIEHLSEAQDACKRHHDEIIRLCNTLSHSLEAIKIETLI